MNLLRSLQWIIAPGTPDTALPWMTFGGHQYPIGGLNQTLGKKQEEIIGNFTGLIQGAYQASGIVFAIECARLLLFVQARFQFRRMSSGRPGDYFGTPQLGILEKPWQGATTGDLLGRMLLSADFGGIAVVVRRHGQIRVLRPDWVSLMLGSEYDPAADGNDPFAELVGIAYHPGGSMQRTPIFFLPGEFAVFAPIPDPLGSHRGMPWLYPVVTDIMGDKAATSHKLQFFEQGATPNLVISGIPGNFEKYNEWIDEFEKRHDGPRNRWKTMYFQGDTKAEVVGSTMQQIDFKAITGQAEVRMCNAARVPPAVVGVSEGIAGASLNSGNFSNAMRQFADLWGRPYWQNVASSLESIIPTQGGAQLWYDDRDIPALKDDISDAAEVQGKQGATIRTLTDAGYKPESVVKAVMSGDFTKLEHTGLYSVQLQPPGTVAKPVVPVDPNAPPVDEPPATGGGKTPAAILAPLTGKKVAP